MAKVKKTVSKKSQKSVKNRKAITKSSKVSVINRLDRLVSRGYMLSNATVSQMTNEVLGELGYESVQIHASSKAK